MATVETEARIVTCAALSNDRATEPLSLMFEENARDEPSRPYIVSLSLEGEDYTFGQFDSDSKAVGRALVADGVKPGDRVAILAENRPRWCVAYAAILQAGGIVVPLDAQLPAEGVLAALKDSAVEAILGSQVCEPTLNRLVSIGFGGRVYSLDDDGPGRHWSDLLEAAPDTELPQKRGGDTPAAVIYTSGTTGNPKGVVLTHENLQGELASVNNSVHFTTDDCLLMFLPMQHVLSQVGGFLFSAAARMRAVHANITRGEELLPAVRDGGVTILLAVPLLYHLMHEKILAGISGLGFPGSPIVKRLMRLNGWLRRTVGVNLGRVFFGKIHAAFGKQLRLMVSGGSALNSRAQRDFLALGFDMCQCYGLTETCGAATYTPAESLVVGSVGKPIAGVSVKINEPNDEGIGEVWLSGPMMTPGYHGRPEATAELRKGEWLCTGDLGRLDDDGTLFITGRSKDVIVLGTGKNVYPEDVEGHYAQSSYIGEICVVSRTKGSGPDQTEKLHAVVVPDWEKLRKVGQSAVRDTVHEEIGKLSAQIPPYMRVLSFEIRRDPLPRTATRKLKRFEVVPFQDSDDEAVPLAPDAPEAAERLASGVGQKTLDLIRKRVGEEAPIQARSSFELDLGLDSLNRMELFLTVEQAFGITIEDEEALELGTVDELLILALSRGAKEQGATGPQSGGWAQVLEESSPEDLPVKLRTPHDVMTLAVFWCLVIVARTMGRILFSLVDKGLENLPKKGAFLICPNHVSFLDAFLVGGLLPFRVIKHCFALGEADYVNPGFAGWLARYCGVVPIDSHRHLRQSMKSGAAGLKAGRVLMVFPEGTRSLTGYLGELKLGSAVLATELDLPIVPVVVRGAFEAWPRGQKRPYFRPCAVEFGKPLHPKDVLEEGESGEAAQQKVNDALRERLIELGAPTAD